MTYGYEIGLIKLARALSVQEGVDVLYHCAGQLTDVKAMRSLHVDATRKLTMAATRRVLHWVQLSSVGVYGLVSHGEITERTAPNPVGPYETTKLKSDKIVINAASQNLFTCSILRPSNVFGEDMSNQSLFRMINMIDRGLFSISVGQGLLLITSMSITWPKV